MGWKPERTRPNGVGRASSMSTCTALCPCPVNAEVKLKSVHHFQKSVEYVYTYFTASSVAKVTTSGHIAEYSGAKTTRRMYGKMTVCVLRYN